MNLNITTRQEVEISDEEANRIARERIRAVFNLPEHPTIRDGQLCTTYVDGGVLTEPIRAATQDDIEAVRIHSRLL